MILLEYICVLIEREGLSVVVLFVLLQLHSASLGTPHLIVDLVFVREIHLYQGD